MNPQLTEAGTASPTGRLQALRALAGTDTGRAGGMAVAVGAMNVLALAFTVVFARVLGAAGYGSLAVLISAFIVLMVGGSALQIATARAVSHAVADGVAKPGRGVRLWLGHLCVAAVVVAVVSIPLRGAIGSVLAVDYDWAAAAVPVTGVLWAVVCVERGALQGLQHYKLVGSSLVGEAVLRLLFALVLVGVGLDVTGAFLGTAAALVGVGLGLWVALSKQLPPRESEDGSGLRRLLAQSWIPVVGLTLLFLLQEVHVIVVKHEASSDAAGSYAVAAVAAKGVIWVAVGLGLYLLPEAARRSRSGDDARRVLARTLALVLVVGVPMIAIYALEGEALLRAVFGEDLTGATDALPWLGGAMTLLACSYLCVQYLLALGRAEFVPVLALAALAGVVVLADIGDDLTRVAEALAALQGVCAAALLVLCLRARTPRRRTDEFLPL